MSCLHPAGSGVFHQWVFSVHVVEDIRMDEGVVQGGIEHLAVFQGTPFHLDSRQILLPAFRCFRSHLVEVCNAFRQRLLLAVKILPGVPAADKGDSHLEFHAFAFLRLEGEPVADVVSGNFPPEALVNLVFAVVRSPFRFHSLHHRLLFPETVP